MIRRKRLDQTSTSVSISKNYRVLLIDETIKDLEKYSNIINKLIHCKIDIISSPSELEDWTGQTDYQLVVIAAPRLELELLEQIKRAAPTTCVILVSNYATVERAVRALRLGAEDYLAKPFKEDAFKLAVKRGLDRKLVFTENSSISSFLDLFNTCQMISGALELGKIFEIIQSYMVRELNASYVSFFSIKSGTAVRIESSSYSDHSDERLEEILESALQSSKPFSSKATQSDLYHFNDKKNKTPAVLVFRFRCMGKSEYLCACLSPKKPPSLEGFESRLQLLKAQIEVTGKNIEQYEGVQHLVFVDDATGLYNTRYLNYVLDREISQAKISNKSFAVLFIDADKFKLINDNHGHLIGTRLLHELGNRLRKCVRENDTVFRYGGDEFVVVLTACDLPTAKVVAERIRGTIAKKVFLKSEKLNISITISIGVALFPDHAKTKKEVIEAADHAMFSAKRTSRNTVCILEARKPPEESQREGNCG